MTPGVDFNRILMAVSERLHSKQLVRIGSRRLMIVRELSPMEYQEKRRQNAAVRHKYNRPFEEHVGMVEGEDAMHFGSTPIGHPIEPPEDCRYFYEAKEL
jgi:hypothetical protein